VHTTTVNKIPASFTGSALLALLLFILAQGASAQSAWYKSNCPRSQKQAGVWYFGEKAGIDFRTGTATPLVDQNVMNALQATSSICDSMGNFQFFTDGRTVWDRTFTAMPNATKLDGYIGVTQPCLIVPWPGDSSLYYVFTVDMIKYDPYDSTKYTTKGLAVTVIDMKLRNGLGDAVSAMLNKPLLSPVCQKITAVSSNDSRGIWVIAHKWESNDFYAYLLTKEGMAAPVVSSVGSIHAADTKLARNNAVGYMKCAPNGKKIALAITYDRIIEVFDFNNETGKVSNPKSYHVTKPLISPYGIEFSPDCKKLYATAFDYLGGTMPRKPSCIYQFDISNGLNNPLIVDSVAGIRLAGMQLGTDGRIYISRTNDILFKKRDSLEVIYNPNRPGNACNFNLLNNTPGSSFPLLGRKSIYSVPNFVQSYLNVPPFTWDSVCQGDVTAFHITNKANIRVDSLTWDFGDGTTSGVFEPMHQYASAGTYTVKLIQKFNGQTFIDSVSVTNYPLPHLNLSDTVLLYKGSSINLHAGGGFTDYLWQTNSNDPGINGSNDSIVKVDSLGSYWVHVKDIHCCVNSDTTYVKVFQYYIPNAFSPNGDGLNDSFGMTGLYKNINFSMIVYDRWGRLVFQSDRFDRRWDGTAGGQVCPPDSYVWIVNVAFKGQDIITNGDIVFKGTVTIVR
jgi:gliding motility-associated-like protein